MWRDGEGKRARLGEPPDSPEICTFLAKYGSNACGTQARPRPQECGTIDAGSPAGIMAGVSLPGRSNSMRRSKALERM